MQSKPSQLSVQVTYHPNALNDLEQMYLWVEQDSGYLRARKFVDQVKDFCDGLDFMPERGKFRPNIGKNVRSTVFNRSVVVTYVIAKDTVVILRIFGKGRNVPT